MAGKQSLTPLKGFRDILPQEAEKRRLVIDRLQKVFYRHGFFPIETPTLERAETLTGKYGEEADTLLYLFEDRGNRSVGLRYDQTVPTARYIAANGGKLQMPFRRYQVQPVFRAEKPQKGRYREFLQCDADIFGTEEGLADAEILSVFWQAYSALGLSKDQIEIQINHRSFLNRIAKDAGVPDSLLQSLYIALDKLDKKSSAEVKAEMQDRGIKKEMVEKLFGVLESSSPPEILESIIKHAIELGVPENALRFQPSLVRGLDYYTGMIFEMKLTSGGSSLGGGGRYDFLIHQLGGPQIPAVGFGMGFDRTLEALEELGIQVENEQSISVLVTVFDTELTRESARLVGQLRSAGIRSELYPDPSKPLAKQLKYADAQSFRFAVILGPDELKDQVCLLKDLSSAEQKQIPIDKLASYLQQ